MKHCLRYSYKTIYIYIKFFYLLRYEQQRVVKDQIAFEIAKTISLFYAEEQKLPSGTKGRTPSRALLFREQASVLYSSGRKTPAKWAETRKGRDKVTSVLSCIAFHFPSVISAGHRRCRTLPLVKNDELSPRTSCVPRRKTHESRISLSVAMCSCAWKMRNAIHFDDQVILNRLLH